MVGAPVTQRLRRESVRWDFAHPEAFLDRRNPKIAELNAANGLLLNATCALDEESTTFELGDSSLDERYSYCDASGQSRPSALAPEASLGIFRDKDRAANGVFNAALAWFLFPDIEFFIIKRVGPQSKNSLAPYGVGDRIKMQLVSTDLMVDEMNGEDPLLAIQNFQQRSFVNWNYILTA